MNEYFKQKDGLILFLCILLAMGLAYWFGIRVMFTRIHDERDAIQTMRVVRENRIRQLGRLGDLSAQYDRIVRDEGLLDIFVAKDHMIDFVKRLEVMAREGRVEITIEAREVLIPKSTKPVSAAAKKADASPSGTDSDTASGKPAAKPKSILETLTSKSLTRLGVQIQGETADVVTYLHRLETLPFAMDVIGVDATRVEKVELKEDKKIPASVAVVNTASTLNPASTDTPSVLPAEGEPDNDPFAEPPVTVAAPVAPEHHFILKLVADVVVYHSE